MSRLIDADKLQEALREFERKEPTLDYICGTMRAGVITDSQPTAYDVEKVMFEIEEYTCKECKETGTNKRFYYGMGCKACAYGKILQIVKRGGIDGKAD